MAMVDIDLTPAEFNLSGVRAGDWNALRITLTNKGDGTPVDLTGYTITAQARVTPLTTGACDATIEDRDDTAGSFLLRWDGDDVRTLLAGQATFSGVWDLQIQQDPNDAITVMAGKFSAAMDVTRPGEALTSDTSATPPPIRQRGLANGDRVRGTVS